jgi:hypothetical protein
MIVTTSGVTDLEKFIENAICNVSSVTNLVTGYQMKRYCLVERNSTDPDACGKEGKKFEPKESC